MERWTRIDEDIDWEPRRVDDWKPPSSSDLFTFFNNTKELRWHNTIIDNAKNLAKSISNVQAVFLKGSFANDTAMRRRRWSVPIACRFPPSNLD